MVDFILSQLNLELYIQQIDRIGYAGDELFLSSLNSNDAIEAPGGFTTYCYDRYGVESQQMTR
jgi:hypothetical protein